MSKLRETLREKIEAWRPRTTNLAKKHADVKLGEVTIGQALGGARGVRCLVTDISYLDPHEGIRFRGFTIPETLDKLPKVPGREMPYVEASKAVGMSEWRIAVQHILPDGEVKRHVLTPGARITDGTVTYPGPPTLFRTRPEISYRFRFPLHRPAERE